MVALGLVSRVIVTSPVKVLLGCACAPPLIPPLSPKLLSHLVARTQLADLGPKFESRVPLAALRREQSGGGYGLAAVVWRRAKAGAVSGIVRERFLRAGVECAAVKPQL